MAYNSRKEFRRDLVRVAGCADRDKAHDASSVGYSLYHFPSLRIPRSLRKYATPEALAEYTRKEKEYSKKLFDILHSYQKDGICPGCEGPYERDVVGFIYCDKCRGENET
jgi:hypothetical protein